MNPNVVVMKDFNKKKLMEYIQELRLQEYAILGKFPRLNTEEFRKDLFSLEEDLQCLFTPHYEPGLDPCYSFFMSVAIGDLKYTMVDTIVLKSSLKLFKKAPTGFTDRLTNFKDIAFNDLPNIVTLEYFYNSSPYNGTTVSFDKVTEVTGKHTGAVNFLAVALSILKPFALDPKENTLFRISNVELVRRENNYFNTDKLLVVTLDDGNHSLVMSLDLTNGDKEFEDHYKRFSE